MIARKVSKRLVDLDYRGLYLSRGGENYARISVPRYHGFMLIGNTILAYYYTYIEKQRLPPFISFPSGK
jgi:hypothetical protein